jgi:hypothetical protein
LLGLRPSKHLKLGLLPAGLSSYKRGITPEFYFLVTGSKRACWSDGYDD